MPNRKHFLSKKLRTYTTVTGIRLDHGTTEQEKKTLIDHLKHCIYWLVINQCLTERKEKETEIEHLKHCIYW